MIVRRFIKSDLHFLKEWLLLHSLPVSFSEELPKLGLMVEDIACGFVRKLENCKMGLVEGYITNPKKKPEERNQALDLLTKSIFVEAKKKGFQKLLFHSIEKTIFARAVQHGFEIMPDLLMLKEL